MSATTIRVGLRFICAACDVDLHDSCLGRCLCACHRHPAGGSGG